MRSVPHKFPRDPGSRRVAVANHERIVNVLREPLRAIGAGRGDFRSQRPNRWGRNPMKREGRNLASAVMALVHLDHESHSTFRSGARQACDSSVVDKWGINFPPPLPSQLLLSSAPYCSERSSSWFRVAVSVSSRSRILSRRRWTRASFASTLRCSFSIIVRRSFSRSCAGVRISRLPRGPPLRVLEAVLVVPLVRVLLMRSLYQVRRRKGTH